MAFSYEDPIRRAFVHALVANPTKMYATLWSFVVLWAFGVFDIEDHIRVLFSYFTSIVDRPRINTDDYFVGHTTETCKGRLQICALIPTGHGHRQCERLRESAYPQKIRAQHFNSNMLEVLLQVPLEGHGIVFDRMLR